MPNPRTHQFFRSLGLEDRILEYEHSSATVELAAQALGCEPARIAKSLAFLIGQQPLLVVTAGDAKVDNQKFRVQFNAKASMCPPDKTFEMIGYEVGGVCPFAVNEGVKIYLDISMKRFATIYPACGSSNSAIEVSMAELEQFSDSETWVDVCKGWNA